MKFLTMLATSFSMLYLMLVVHAFSFPSQKKAEELTALSLHVKDAKPSLSFPTNAYQRFVYVP
ncbi:MULTISPECIES: hypothetical protein [unclassified Sulfurospirillum]|uniref:hypothetical protein n=1 Tax=unclassified Sulfurospirillum TaxID=2618290 RepID=UPI000506AF9F|nr:MULTISPECIES: hypothetical protein [unclassified Sulfurospirillum]KFL34667.1 hypothetical protein JU57_05025 [Sulfurospirillum sp. SCADC]